MANNKKRNSGTKGTSNIKNINTKKQVREREIRVANYHKTEVGPFFALCVVFVCLVYFAGASMYTTAFAETVTVKEPVIEEVVEAKVIQTNFLHTAPLNYEDVERQRAELLANKRAYAGASTANFIPNGSIMDIARSQVGNVGGEPYWTWAGFPNWTAWCAIFASWCADQSGMIASGVVPKFTSVGAGVNHFISNGQWASGSAVPSSGMYIFFDYDCNGSCDHVGLVDSCDGTTLYCVEGNYNNSVAYTSYPVGHYSIAGYGMPNY